MSQVTRTGVAVATAADGHSVHIVPRWLEPGREYFYRFYAEGYATPVARTRTAPAFGHLARQLRLAVASCARYEDGFFTAYRRIAELAPDLIVHLGDYLYEYPAAGTPPADQTTPPRLPVGPETVTLANYRQRHAQYRTDPDLQAAHAVAAWAVVLDDHEVDNNWADEIHEKPELPQPDFLARRAAAFQAYWENMPLRDRSRPQGIDMRLYRRIRWGRLATLHMLDTRQHRDDQACGDGYQSCPESADPRRTLTGSEQEEWLLDGFRGPGARWDLLAQQVFFGQRDSDVGPRRVVSQDAWDGYPASRDRITRGWVEAGVRNPVVLTGDVHAHWAGQIALDYDDPAAAPVGAELVCTSISTDGDGADAPGTAHPWLRNNPQLRFCNRQRGFILATVTPEQIEADFRVLPYVRRAGAPAYSRARFVIDDRVPGLRQTYDRKPTSSFGSVDPRDTVASESADH